MHVKAQCRVKSCVVNELVLLTVFPLCVLKSDYGSLNITVLVFNRCYISNHRLIIM